MVPLLSLLVALTVAEDPFAGAGAVSASPAVAGVPTILWIAPDVLHDAWRDVRAVKGEGAVRVHEYHKRQLEHAVCPGLVDLRAVGAAEAGFRWQADVARREWARPALARVLIEAHRAWRERWPKQALGIGDVAQAGCGQVDPGTLTRLVRGPDADALAALAQPVAGVPTVIELTQEGKTRILNERRVVGRDAAEPLLFVHLRRYREVGGDAGGPGGLEAKVRAIVEHGELTHEIEGPDARGATEWRQHWVDPKHHRQAIIVLSEKPDAHRPFRLAHARDVRIAPWAPARPGEMRGEKRWTLDGGDPPAWHAWQLIEEGAHVTHMAGLDADVSYPMKDPARRFATDPEGIDLKAAWDWFETLVATGERLGTPIDRIVVGGRVLPRLMNVAGAKQSVVVKKKLFKVVANHDDHQHIRLARPSPEAESAALGILTMR